MIRGGSGLYFASPVSNVHLQPQVYSQLVTATLRQRRPARLHHQPDQRRHRRRLLLGRGQAPAQSPRVIVADFKSPYTWQSSIGFQKQLNAVTGFDVDLTHCNEYRDTRTIDPNLFYDPATGYNRNPAPGRPNPAYGQVLAFTSDGHRDQTQLATGLTRRLQEPASRRASPTR